jgi:hypothetical protein
MSLNQRIKLSHQHAKALPLGAIARYTDGWKASLGMCYVRTGDSTWAQFRGEVSRSQILEAIAKKQNNLSPYPTDWVEISFGLVVPE